MNCKLCKIPMDMRVCTLECKKGYIHNVRSKAGRVGGKLGGKRVHEIYPGKAVEWGKKTHELHPYQSTKVIRETLKKYPELSVRAGKLGGERTAKIHPEHMSMIGRLGLIKHSEIRKKLSGFRSETEKILWDNQQFQRFNPESEPTLHFDTRYGCKWVYPDFYIESVRLVIEIDGSIHNKKIIKERDRIKDELLDMYGYKILRFTNEEVAENIDEVINKIEEVVCL